uniref:Uncharacterized protein n=1 Tax=Rhizophora mucronata TaxID=61149 RepID=A0A2P2N7D5_RHIMU
MHLFSSIEMLLHFHTMNIQFVPHQFSFLWEMCKQVAQDKIELKVVCLLGMFLLFDIFT